MSDTPLVSIVIPAYRSDRTIGGTLRALLSQTYTCYEIIVVDSSPDQTTEQLIAAQFPQIQYRHVTERMLPHAARNLGLTLARGPLFALTDPDAYAHPDWLATLVAAHKTLDGVIVGGVACFGDDWLNQGLHLAKFDKWLPGGPIRSTDISPTLNMLISRADFEKVGGFDGQYMIGDTEFSWQLTRHGVPMQFVPAAIVEHHHTDTWRNLLREMYERGLEFGRLRLKWGRWSKLKVFYFLLISASGLRLVKIMGRVSLNALRANQFFTLLKTIPIVASAHIARLAGEVHAYWDYLL